MKSILTPYFTKDESTFNPRSLENVLNQAGVEQKIYGVASPIGLKRHGFNIENIVVPTRPSWSVPVRMGVSI